MKCDVYINENFSIKHNGTTMTATSKVAMEKDTYV